MKKSKIEKELASILRDEIEKEIEKEKQRLAYFRSLNSNSEIASHLKTISKQRKKTNE